MKPISYKIYAVIMYLIPGLFMAVTGFVQALSESGSAFQILFRVLAGYMLIVFLYTFIRGKDKKDEMSLKHFRFAGAATIPIAIITLFVMDLIEFLHGIRFYNLLPIGIMMFSMGSIFLYLESKGD